MPHVCCINSTSGRTKGRFLSAAYIHTLPQIIYSISELACATSTRNVYAFWRSHTRMHFRRNTGTAFSTLHARMAGTPSSSLSPSFVRIASHVRASLGRALSAGWRACACAQLDLFKFAYVFNKPISRPATCAHSGNVRSSAACAKLS